ncbi:MAG: hypothetical protein GXO02_04635 [Epsilonproteobacteria bacterium]|nr:hypothetical protein [Campylobacterota bacterium]
MRKRVLILTILIVVSLLSSFAIFNKLYLKEKRVDIDYLIKNRINKDLLEKEIKESLNKKDYYLAIQFKELANRLNIEINSTLTKEILKNRPSKFNEFLKGFIKGEIDSPASFSGTIASDFLIIGDIRDLYKEGKKYINNQPYDKITLYLSMSGIALTFISFETLFLSTPIKGTISTLKVANRTKKLTKSFKLLLLSSLEKDINIKSLKKIDFSSYSNFKNSISIIKRSISFNNSAPIFKELNKIRKNSSPSEMIEMLKYVQNYQDLKTLSKLSQNYLKNIKNQLLLF